MEINEIVGKQIKDIQKKCDLIKPLVVVWCLTYNHEAFIKQALEGFISQKTHFPFVIIIHDDVSSDGTVNIIKEYSEKYPDMILPIFEEDNQFSKSIGFLDNIMKEACVATGAKYIAFCEGDDYWIDCHKLQKQVNYLEANADYGMCYTKAKVMCGEKIVGVTGTNDTSFKGLISYSNFPTLTRLFRVTLFENYVNEIKPYNRSWMMCDYPFAFYCTLKSKIGFIDESTAVYRLLENSASHSRDINYLIRFYESADEVRKFFVNNYIESKDKLKEYQLIIKKNEINYKMLIYLKSNKIDLAKTLY
nr:glycosyltransferase [Muribaculaceae bacterium]